ncbi:hypothetical protein CYMTET_22772 [Cymbomonas tetramitiformis]|uniref:Importin N-terminal domain-containing protein n=1 Tax=Cymbomonas tetramitiformis TaxID=36881 RepID=A0AAE0FZL1_9CHLO|nr:hypothetical protein CYMTET_22772 [Cymbomonas tetramitiformis]
MEVEGASPAQKTSPSSILDGVEQQGVAVAKVAGGVRNPQMEFTAAHIETLLLDTRDPSRIKEAEMALNAYEASPGFAGHLLSLCHTGSNEQTMLPAATYFQNLVRKHWSNSTTLPNTEQAAVRAALLQTLFVAPPTVVKQLAEAFRVIAAQDFATNKCWPDLITDIGTGLQNSNMMPGKQDSPISTENALIAVHTLLKPYKYFRNPQLAKEVAPAELEAITQSLLNPLFDIFHLLVGQAVASEAEGAAPHDHILNTLCKCFHHTVQAYMPAALEPRLKGWMESMLRLLEGAAACPVAVAAQLPRGKVHKRCLQICISMVTRHRRKVDGQMQQMCAAAGKLVHATAAVTAASTAERDEAVAGMQGRQMSLSFDLLARMLETGPGCVKTATWRLGASAQRENCHVAPWGLRAGLTSCVELRRNPMSSQSDGAPVVFDARPALPVAVGMTVTAGHRLGLGREGKCCTSLVGFGVHAVSGVLHPQGSA